VVFFSRIGNIDGCVSTGAQKQKKAGSGKAEQYQHKRNFNPDFHGVK
jgi:hypothetical protein